MKIDATLDLASLDAVVRSARDLEAAGYDGLWSSESTHDPFLPLALAASATSRATLGTAIAVAFARTPMALAYVARDLQAYSRGRFVLGLGTQVKAHIERRYAMPWSRPADRMREFVLALRAIWHSWESGERLAFEGEFYTHTLMPPFFSPGPSGYGVPAVIVAAVGQRMTEVAGEVADGVLLHGFTTERYVREVTLPALARGAARAGASSSDRQVAILGFVASGEGQALDAAVDGVRLQVAFYASTPAYRPVMELHGWGDIADRLHELSREGGWDRMGALVTDEMVETFAVVAPPEAMASRIMARYGDVVNRFQFYTPYPTDPLLWARVRGDLAVMP